MKIFKSNLIRLSFLLSVTLLLLACQKDRPWISGQEQDFSPLELAALPSSISDRGVSLLNPQGLLILSEGNMESEPGHLSFVDQQVGGYANGVIRAINGRSLGNVAQHLTVYKERLYILSQNGTNSGYGDMAHISVFDKSFRLIEDYTPDIVIEANGREHPEYIAVAHDNVYFYAGGLIYECSTEPETKGECQLLVEMQAPLAERLYRAHRSSGEYLYAVGKRHVYQLDEASNIKKYLLPRGYESLGMTVVPRLAQSEDIYAWVLCRETKTKQIYIIKLRNLEQEIIYPIPIEITNSISPKELSLDVVMSRGGAMLFFRYKGTVYKFETEGQKLHTIYRSGRNGSNRLYGYMGIDPIRRSIYLSEFEDYPQYAKGWVSELAFNGQVKQTFLLASREEIGLTTTGIYTSFCAGIYPLTTLHRD